MQNSLSEQQDWQPVDTAYLPYLRTIISIIHLILVSSTALFLYFMYDAGPLRILAISALAFFTFTFFWSSLHWAPRRFKRMRYCSRDLDINYQCGFLFFKTVSIPLNRVQHIEVKQGPVQGYFGISDIVIYTAGTLGSDLKIPGLAVENANAMKQQLLNSIKHDSQDNAE